MDDDRSQRAVAKRLFVLVGPAAVVSERAPGEELRIVRVRLVGEQNQNLPADVGALEIVPLEFGCHDSVTHKHGLGVELFDRVFALVGAHKVVQVLQRHGAAARQRFELRIRLCFDAHQRHLLEIGAAVAGRFGARQRELSGQELGCDLPAAHPHTAALEQVAGEKLHIGADAIAGDVLHLAGARRRQDQDQRCWSHIVRSVERAPG